jgi:BppU N-terminal domain/Zinc carboxypeptidase
MSVIKSYSVQLDIAQELKNTHFSFSQNDVNTAKIIVTLTNRKAPIVLTGATVRFAFLKADGTRVYQDATITDPTKGIAEVILSSQVLAVPKRVKTEVEIYFDGTQQNAVTKSFEFEVERAILSDESLASRNDLPVIRQLQETALDSNSFWTPPTQPNMKVGTGGVIATKDPELLINTLYETLRADNTDYITRTTIGKDQSNTYNIYEYAFTPKNYQKTMIFSAGTHGNEITTIMALARFMYHLVNDWRTYPQLAYIRKNVRIIVLPLVNPWGFANSKRQNSNLVDLNRNSDYLWNYITSSSYQPGGTNYKGTAPFSEKESQYVKATLEKYSSALAFQDLHCIVSNDAEKIVYTSRYIAQFQEVYQDTIDYLWNAGDRMVNGTSATACFHCYAASKFAMTTANPEWHDGKFGAAQSPAEMQACLAYMGNILINCCRLKQKTNTLENSEPWTKVFVYDKTAATTSPITVTTLNAFTNVPHTVFDVNIKRLGILKMSGYLKFTLSAAATITINPFFYQSYHPDLSFGDTKDAATNLITLTLPAGTHIVPLNARYHCFPTNYNTGSINRTAEAKTRIRVKLTAGTFTAESWRMYVDYTPSRKGYAYEWFDATGNEAVTENTTDYVRMFPDPAKFVDVETDE